MRCFGCLIVLCLLVTSGFSQKAAYLAQIKAMTEKGWQEYPGVIERWKQNYNPSNLWGYDSPGQPIYLASSLAFLYELTKDRSYAERAIQILSTYGDLRDTYPKDYWKTRAEYVNGIPAISNFFFIPPYMRAYLRIRDSRYLDAAAKAKIEKEVAHNANFIFHFPEWGAHNRAMLRAEALQYTILALKDHPEVEKWKKMTEALAYDNLHGWEIEDATVYHPVWLLSLFSYAEASGHNELWDSPLTKYYLKYFVKLIGPDGRIPDFGDANWGSCWESLRFVAIFEKGASVFRDPEMKWAAKTIFEGALKRGLGSSDAYSLSDAYRWADESIPAKAPTDLSQEVLDDVVGKKIVFRNGRKDTDTYMLLTYRDEGDGGWLDREFLRQSLSVEEEKMHHGHSDENSIAVLMDKGAVLLHDAGYRDALPSGEYGAFRADYFHNRVVVRKDKRDSHQKLMEYIRNSGAYRPVQTKKIDFLTLNHVDMSRTRLVDENLGYQWDRIIAYMKERGFFVVVDDIKALRTDYFTFTNLWHTQKILEQGERYFKVANDSIRQFKFLQNQGLLIYFPENYAKTIGSEPIRRQYQDELAIYQTIASHYKAGDHEAFITILAPIERAADPKAFMSEIQMLNVSTPGKAIGIRFGNDQESAVLGVKLDMEMEIARENIRPRYLYDLGKVRYGDFETDGHFFFAMIKAGSIDYSVSNVLKVLYKDKVLMAALPNAHALQLDGAPDRTGFVKWRFWQDLVRL